MKDINIFLSRLHELTDSLEILSRDFSAIHTQYDGNDFDIQNRLATDTLENLIHTATHEMASTIGFIGMDIKTLTNFIKFRRIYKKFTDKELETIINDFTINSAFKLELCNRLTEGNKKLLLSTINEIKHVWNNEFNNKSYSDIRGKFFS